MGIEKSELDQCIYNVLVEDADVQGVIQKTATENLDVLPLQFNWLVLKLNWYRLFPEVRLQRALQPVRDEYDYIIIDCPHL